MAGLGAACRPPLERERLAGRSGVPPAVTEAMQAELASLKAANRELQQEVRRLRQERPHLIDVEAVHQELDRLDVPRLDPLGGRQFLSQRFAVLQWRKGGGER